MKNGIKNYLRKAISLLFRLAHCAGCYIRCCAGASAHGKRTHPSSEGAGKTVLVLGNGPSLAGIDLKQIKKETEICCVNWFANRNGDFFSLKPRFYCLLDPVFFKKAEAGYAFTKEKAQLWDNFRKVDWDMTIITAAGYALSNVIDNPHIRFAFIARDIAENPKNSPFIMNLYKKNKANCGLQNVLIGATFYFIMQKYDNIYLAGVDMSEFKAYSVDKNNHVFVEYSHFYGTTKVDCTENGRIPKGEFYKWLGYYALMLKQFYYLSLFASFQGVRVRNLTENSFVDVFEKTDWADLTYENEQ